MIIIYQAITEWLAECLHSTQLIQIILCYYKIMCIKNLSFTYFVSEIYMWRNGLRRMILLVHCNKNIVQKQSQNEKWKSKVKSSISNKVQKLFYRIFH